MKFSPLTSAEEMLNSIPPGWIGPIKGIDYRQGGTLKAYEIQLEVSYHKIIKLINSSNLSYYLKKKWLIENEFAMRLVTEGINLAVNDNKPFKKYIDEHSWIIAKPNAGGYSKYVAEHIMHLEDFKIPFFLDFQLLEYENVFNTRFEFYGLMEHFVSFQLSNSYPINFKSKVDIIANWLNKEYISLERKEYDSYRYFGLSVAKKDILNAPEEESTNKRTETVDQSNTSNSKTIIPGCEKRKTELYFNLLRKPNPKNNKPFLSQKAINWILQNFDVDKKIKSPPDYTLNLEPKYLLVFFHIFYYYIDKRPQKKTGKSLEEYAIFLQIHFPKEFSKKSIVTIKTDFNRFKNKFYGPKSDHSFPNELDYKKDMEFSQESFS